MMLMKTADSTNLLTSALVYFICTCNKNQVLILVLEAWVLVLVLVLDGLGTCYISDLYDFNTVGLTHLGPLFLY